jgi:hypothetical protein
MLHAAYRHGPGDEAFPRDASRGRTLSRARRLWCWPSRRQKWTEKEVILCVLRAVSIRVFPPAAAEISRLPGTKLCLAVGQELEPAVHWQRVFDDERVVVQALARHEDDPWCAVAES